MVETRETVVRGRLVAMCQIAGCDALLLDESAVHTLHVRYPGGAPSTIQVCGDCVERFAPTTTED